MEYLNACSCFWVRAAERDPGADLRERNPRLNHASVSLDAPRQALGFECYNQSEWETGTRARPVFSQLPLRMQTTASLFTCVSPEHVCTTQTSPTSPRTRTPAAAAVKPLPRKVRQQYDPPAATLTSIQRIRVTIRIGASMKLAISVHRLAPWVVDSLAYVTIRPCGICWSILDSLIHHACLTLMQTARTKWTQRPITRALRCDRLGSRWDYSIFSESG